MTKFENQTPTRLIFGEGVVEKLQKVMSGFGKKILLTYGGGSIKKIPAFRGKAGSLYDYVRETLKEFPARRRMTRSVIWIGTCSLPFRSWTRHTRSRLAGNRLQQVLRTR